MQVIEANLKDMDYTAPMVNRLNYKKANSFKNYKGNACNLKLKAFENREFDFVREEDAFKKLIVMRNKTQSKNCGAVGTEKAFEKKKAACAVIMAQAAFLPSGDFSRSGGKVSIISRKL